ncbi:nucleotidyltransferase family protein [Candidatus Magnetominusculus xianensis]|uniref:D-glycero-D-manno-heptose 1-phosphate guanosyltransferase n=1 Tax=Candidatus Magnetominusculus xianensis TaxID=1748249 RepID=A0ABR5SJS3_9BACT|nr:nucleotidyltransferase family protein [Candidatus Magnetominusculus xianensis]KWT85893.1 D-glycero-D-manno-heptose 1-phosphate guanosyltransferase [Candidatus Magnetominusculus xianensis]MBF0403566.1 nucleotidyltransferase family protein [Nitrospirota bacterium]
MQLTDAIILAGGLGTRLRPVVDALPKVMAPVNGRPFLDILLGHLSRYDFIKRVVIAVGFMADKIIGHYRGTDRYSFEILFSVEEQLLGTGGALKQAVQYTKTPEVIALNGDTFAGVDIKDLVSAHLQRSASLTIALKEMKDCSRYGTVALDAVGRVVSFHEKTSVDGLINAGIYVFNRALFNNRPEGVVMSLEREFLPSLLPSDTSDSNIFGYRFNGRFIDIGVPETYNIAGDYLLDVQRQ